MEGAIRLIRIVSIVSGKMQLRHLSYDREKVSTGDCKIIYALGKVALDASSGVLVGYAGVSATRLGLLNGHFRGRTSNEIGTGRDPKVFCPCYASWILSSINHWPLEQELDRFR